MSLPRDNTRLSSPSHSCLILSATIPFDPAQTPLVSVATQLPLNEENPVAHSMQFDARPLQVSHDDEQSEHPEPTLYDPSGHLIPLDVVSCG